ncbi:hypothetical protein C3L50_09495 [Flavobacterium alvei]|uniref:BatD protein n=1 Tax=Flavobacterium alvei TaxID=2080416 RepID=A0A2S5ABS7_9FLAO|nr:BatD family protein [Flavobacterium alvei]POY40041.1 hypothetical protein C3L50_09495 [Flavobacterium alvei]
MKKFIIAIVLIACNSLLAQVQFEAKVSKTTIGLNERLRIDFVMNMDGDNFTQPTFKGFKVIAGPVKQVSESWANKKKVYKKEYSYYLLPIKKGNLRIKQAMVEYEGKVYKTSPVKVNVTARVEK